MEVIGTNEEIFGAKKTEFGALAPVYLAQHRCRLLRRTGLKYEASEALWDLFPFLAHISEKMIFYNFGNRLLVKESVYKFF